MATVRELYNFLNKNVPFEAQESWDNSGIQVGDFNQTIHKIAVVLDVTPETLEQAGECGADVIVSHHPVLFKAVKSLTSGNLAYESIRRGISIISSHTSFDVAPGGVSDVLLEKIGAIPCELPEDINGCIRLGKIADINIHDFAKSVSESLNADVRFSDGGRIVSKVAVCGGSGCSLLDDVIKTGADTYVTGDAGHHDFLDFKSAGINLIAAGHFETENIAMYKLAEKIQNAFSDCNVEVLKQESPIQHIHK